MIVISATGCTAQNPGFQMLGADSFYSDNPMDNCEVDRCNSFCKGGACKGGECKGGGCLCLC
ncbi:hypothetical protein ZOSMA_25G00940 [Zostera marina]|uniref:Uncharacterized protein n=1 Tax=Zostera marina TaxID=29655 RepID=A0A0K9PHK7_ZOSMR|nr:hypothetical protein ZOSMA_25G00940 [Zostera marina]